ncbi:hypothetical protein PR048_021667 [Dryococelus australis]|uniref:PiggyBac transposable element-derived protein domain-containing protein n=1 Tax=Dryococelus australis TaxID=614101 RepID=A0ABQ9GYU7_9NEOP|nr:hypothetical protein PR048_021667 [Dryococelus australis]
MNDNVVNHIVAETNKYGSGDNIFLVLMGILQKPTIHNYWSKVVTTDTPYFRSVMPQRRFLAINRYLHFVDSETLGPTNPLHKILPVISMASKSFRLVYTPLSDVCIDESLMKCRGRLHFIQYNKSKSARFRVKFYKLCFSKNSYICDLKSYVGKDKTNGTPANLFRRLFPAGTNVCGKVRTNRKNMPRELFKQSLKVGEAVPCASNNLTALKWKIKRDACILSTKHTLYFAETGEWGRKTKKNKS